MLNQGEKHRRKKLIGNNIFKVVQIFSNRWNELVILSDSYIKWLNNISKFFGNNVSTFSKNFQRFDETLLPIKILERRKTLQWSQINSRYVFVIRTKLTFRIDICKTSLLSCTSYSIRLAITNKRIVEFFEKSYLGSQRRNPGYESF